MSYFAVFITLSSSSSSCVSLCSDSSISESSTDSEMLHQLLQRCEFQHYDSTTSACDDPSWSYHVIEVVSLQILLPTDPVPANITVLALPVPKNHKIDQENSECSKGKGKAKAKATKAKGKARQRRKAKAKAKEKGRQKPHAKPKGKARQTEDVLSCPTKAFVKL